MSTNESLNKLQVAFDKKYALKEQAHEIETKELCSMVEDLAKLVKMQEQPV